MGKEKKGKKYIKVGKEELVKSLLTKVSEGSAFREQIANQQAELLLLQFRITKEKN